MVKTAGIRSGFVSILITLSLLTLSWQVERRPHVTASPILPIGKHAIENGMVYRVVVKNPDTADYAVYHIFIPNGLDTVRGVFVHQHGCGMEGRGESTAYDIQYQAFAKKWGLAIVGPDLYYQSGCMEWRDPASGSGPSLMRALEEVGTVSTHPELKEAPWLLWGHSGGGYWTLGMMKDYPDRILAAFCYSPAFDPAWDYPEAALRIPLMIRHAGAGDANASGVRCWQTAVNTFQKLRAEGGLVSIAYTPYQNHNYSFVRYMAIPFYESVLSKRLPTRTQVSFEHMKDLDKTAGWLGDIRSLNTYAYSKYPEDRSAGSWLPDSAIAAKWKEFVITGTVIDRTSPPAPYGLTKTRRHNMAVELTWHGDADVESGIKQFCIYDGDRLIARFPEQGVYQRFDTNGDDAIPMPALPMRTVVALPEGADSSLSISAINHFDLESPRVAFPTK